MPKYHAVGPDGRFGRANTSANRIIFDQASPSDETEIEITFPDDSPKGKVRFVQADRIVNFPGTWGADSPTGGFVRQFELREPDQWGADEQPVIGQFANDSRYIIAAVQHLAHGIPFLSAPLTLWQA